jgi:hypothetical protein
VYQKVTSNQSLLCCLLFPLFGRDLYESRGSSHGKNIPFQSYHIVELVTEDVRYESKVGEKKDVKASPKSKMFSKMQRETCRSSI